MSNYNHRLFLEETTTLLKSIVLKSEYSALNINELLASNPAAGVVNQADKTTWKYYLNLAGKRHPTDPQIRVISMDTAQPIDFTPENLLVHTATARAYQPGMQKYKELLQSYPGMELLIHGILFPVDIQKAINAKDFTILNWSREHVEPQEENLIPDLQDWIYGMVDRFYVRAMDMAEELYTAGFIGTLYTLMPQLIITLRQAAVKTDRAHSFHIKAYLGSHRRLDRYYESMNTRQAMFLYRNIKHLLVNAGQNDTFDWLQEELLTRRSLPLAQYSAEQLVSPHNTELVPTVSFFSRALSRVPSLAAASISTSEILAKEVTLAPGNLNEIDGSATEIEGSLAYANLASSDTKVLESSVLQTTEGSSRTLQDTALSLWAMAAGTERFTTFIYFTDPISGEQIGLSAIDAYHYFTYAYFRSMGVQLSKIPAVIAVEAPLWPKPNFESIYSSLNPKYTSRSFAQRMYNLQASARTFSNNDQFHAFVESQANTLNDMYTVAAYPESLIGRNDALRLLDLLNYTQLIKRPEEGTSFESFLLARQLPVGGLSTNQWKDMYSEIFEKATGQELTQVEARSAMQMAMVRLMSHLSSYSVQFVSQITGSQVTSLRWSAIRFGEAVEGGGMVYTANLWPFRIMEEEVLTGPSYFINIPSLLRKFVMLSPPSRVEQLDLNITLSNTGAEGLGAAGLGFGVVVPEQWKPGNAVINELEDLSWMAPLPTTKELSELNDRYSSLCARYPELPAKVEIGEFVRSERLNSFYAMGGVNRVLRGWIGFSAARQLRYFGNDLTIIVLDAFHSIFGDVEADAFDMVPLVNLLDMFKYVEPLPEDPYDNFVFADDMVTLGSVRYGPTPNDKVVGSFKLREAEVVVPDAGYLGTSTHLEMKHHSAAVHFGFKLSKPKYTLQMKYSGRNILLPLKPAVGTVVTSFYFQGDPVVLAPIRFSYRNMTPGIKFVFAHPNYRLPKPKYGSTRAYTQLRFYGTKVLPKMQLKGKTVTGTGTRYRGTKKINDGFDPNSSDY